MENDSPIKLNETVEGRNGGDVHQSYWYLAVDTYEYLKGLSQGRIMQKWRLAIL